jgi:hypothetical protein
MQRHTQIIYSDEVLTNFCPGWPQTVILSTYVSQVAGIIGESHCAYPNELFLLFLIDNSLKFSGMKNTSCTNNDSFNTYNL